MKKIILIAIIMIGLFSSCKEKEEYGSFKFYARYEFRQVELMSKHGGENYIFNTTEASDIPDHPYMYVANKVIAGNYDFYLLHMNGFHSLVKEVEINEDQTYVYKTW